MVELWTKYYLAPRPAGSPGLVILAFPCNQFGGQEPKPIEGEFCVPVHCTRIMLTIGLAPPHTFDALETDRSRSRFRREARRAVR